MCPDLFELPNPYGKVTTQSRTVQRQQQKLEQWNHKASMANQTKQLELNKIKSSNNLFLLCRFCESRLVKKKNIKKDIGFGNTIEVECHVCPVDKSKWIGNKPHIHHIDKTDLEAELVEFSGVR